MSGSENDLGDSPLQLMREYQAAIADHIDRIVKTSWQSIIRAGKAVAAKVASDEIVYVYGPGGHSNLAAQEVFFRAGGLANVSAILDGGTLLSGGALRSMAVERLPGYGRLVIDDNGLTTGDLLILVNAYGINAALIDAAMRSREVGASIIGVSSRIHADSTPLDHPARHPSKGNLHDLVDIHVDTCVPVGDAVLQDERVAQRFGAISTFANAFAMNCIVATAIRVLADQGVEAPVLRSGNAPGGDEVSKRLLASVRTRVRWL